MGFNCSGPLICMFFFPDKYTFGSHPWVSNRGLNQPLVENSTLESWLGISGCRGLTVCMVLAIIHKGFEHSQLYMILIMHLSIYFPILWNLVGQQMSHFHFSIPLVLKESTNYF